MQEGQQLLPLRGRQPAQRLRVPVGKDPVTDHKGLFALRSQPQTVAAPQLFPRQKAVLDQLDKAALGVSPVQMQLLGQLRGGAVGVLSDVEDEI